MRRIDLFCKLLAPVFISLVDSLSTIRYLDSIRPEHRIRANRVRGNRPSLPSSASSEKADPSLSRPRA